MKVAIGPSSFAAVDEAPLSLLQENGLEIVPNPFGRKLTENEIIDHLKGVHGLLAGLEPLNQNVFANSPDLRAIARVGIGMDNVELEAAINAGIKVSNTPDSPTDAVAEMTLAAALTLARNIAPSNNAMHQKKWVKTIGVGIINTNVLIIVYGRIGRKVSKLFKAIGGHIFVCDPIITKNELESDEVLVTLEDGLKSADIITLHAEGNTPILTTIEFEQMQNGVMILNSARGNLIAEGALMKAIESGKVASAWMDVFPEEPYMGKLTEYEQVLLTPHISTYTIQCRRKMELSAVNNLLRDLEIK